MSGLRKVFNTPAVRNNLRAERASGKPQKQAVADVRQAAKTAGKTGAAPKRKR